jgi:16S rRNA (cytidine1402-2'-O)-methyltransferase
MVLYVVATPIGNLEDITTRALRVLREVDVIASEDTRETGKLLALFGISKPLVSYYRGVERQRTEHLIGLLKSGKSVALVCDRGTPGISDPAHYLVSQAHKERIPIVPVPGPSALAAALSVSGIEVDRFRFLGFLPKKESAKEKLFDAHQDREECIVFFESPHRFSKTMGFLAERFPRRRMTVCRELTKKFEEIISGTVNQLHEHFSKRPAKGEFVIILEGKQHDDEMV